MISIEPIILSLKLSLLTSLILIFLTAPIAWLISQSPQHRNRWVIEALVYFPLILPPAALGFYLLLLLGQNGPFASLHLAFHFSGILIGSIVYSFSFVIQPLFVAFETLPRAMFEFAKVDAVSNRQRFFFLALPLSYRSILRAFFLGFSHTMGSFGVLVILGGSIEGQTKVASIALWEKIENGQYDQAHFYALAMVASSLFILLLMRLIAPKPDKSFMGR